MAYLSYITTAIAMAAFVLTIYNTRVLSKRFQKILSRDAMLKRSDQFLRFNQFFIDDPRLLSLFDDHPISKQSFPDQDLLIAKKEVTVYYLLNAYEYVHHSYEEDPDAGYEKLWKNIVQRMLSTSTFARQMLTVRRQSGFFQTPDTPSRKIP